MTGSLPGPRTGSRERPRDRSGLPRGPAVVAARPRREGRDGPPVASRPRGRQARWRDRSRPVRGDRPPRPQALLRHPAQRPVPGDPQPAAGVGRPAGRVSAAARADKGRVPVAPGPLARVPQPDPSPGPVAVVGFLPVHPPSGQAGHRGRLRPGAQRPLPGLGPDLGRIVQDLLEALPATSTPARPRAQRVDGLAADRRRSGRRPDTRGSSCARSSLPAPAGWRCESRSSRRSTSWKRPSWPTGPFSTPARCSIGTGDITPRSAASCSAPSTRCGSCKTTPAPGQSQRAGRDVTIAGAPGDRSRRREHPRPTRSIPNRLPPGRVHQTNPMAC